jgi:hypothetical protein
VTRLDPSACTLEAWLAASRPLVAARRKVAAASERRYNLPAGSSRARVTTANARWATAAEACDRIERDLRDQWDAAQRGEVSP